MKPLIILLSHLLVISKVSAHEVIATSGDHFINDESNAIYTGRSVRQLS